MINSWIPKKSIEAVTNKSFLVIFGIFVNFLKKKSKLARKQFPWHNNIGYFLEKVKQLSQYNSCEFENKEWNLRHGYNEKKQNKNITRVYDKRKDSEYG